MAQHQHVGQVKVVLRELLEIRGLLVQELQQVLPHQQHGQENVDNQVIQEPQVVLEQELPVEQLVQAILEQQVIQVAQHLQQTRIR